MAINQITTANTFQQWLIATQGLITVANTLTDGNGQTFIANTILEVSGSGATFIVKNTATINIVSANTITTGNLTVTSNITRANITNDLKVGGNTVIHGNANIVGDLTVTGNLTLDTIGFDDLSVAGSGSFGNTLSVTGATTLSNVTVSGNVTTLNVSTTTNLGGNVNVTGSTFISGDLVVGGNITLDAVGFDDLSVAGSTNIGNTLTVGSNTTLGANLVVAGTSNTTGNATFVNAEVTGTLTAAFLTGNANTQIQTSLLAVEAAAVAFSIALG